MRPIPEKRYGDRIGSDVETINLRFYPEMVVSLCIRYRVLAREQMITHSVTIDIYTHSIPILIASLIALLIRSARLFCSRETFEETSNKRKRPLIRRNTTVIISQVLRRNTAINDRGSRIQQNIRS
jgi:L-lactate permease